VKVLSVINRIISELTDQMVKRFKIEGINTIGELKEFVKDKVYYEKLMVESTRIINEVIHGIINDSEVKLDSEEIKELKYEIFEDFKTQLKEREANLETYLAYAKKTYKRFSFLNRSLKKETGISQV